MSLVKLALLVVTIAFVVYEIAGHGMMIDPPNRSSLWRFNKSFPINYNDNENFCGGFGVQWGVHKGKCGVCGDNYADKIPRKNENTGKYGLGYVVEEYKKGSVIGIDIILTANHKGEFSYSICNLKETSKPETDDCFKDVLFADGSKTFKVESGIRNFHNKVQLPADLTCNRCVLRWNYKAGNNWGNCPSGGGAVGCGPQETFRSCSDIAIV